MAYLLGTFLLAMGTAMVVFGTFGISMVVAPAYILHLKLSQVLPWFSYGVAAYVVQGVLLVIMMLILRRFRLSYLFSFVTAVLYALEGDLSYVPHLYLDSAAMIVSLVSLGKFLEDSISNSFIVSHLTFITISLFTIFIKSCINRHIENTCNRRKCL